MINLDYITRAHEFFKATKFDEALKYYYLELTMDPGNVSIMINIGFIHYFLYNLQDAREYFMNAIQLAEENQIAWFGLFLVARRMGDRLLEQEALYKVYEINDIPFELLLENIETFYEN